jgi:hypothetical protein
VGQRLTPITLSASQWWCLFAIVPLLIPGFMAFVLFQHEIAAFEVLHDLAPALQREFGFTAAIVEDERPIRDQTFVITSLDPAGALAKAGFLVGDVPLGYKHGFDTGFYLHLEGARCDATEMRVIHRSRLGLPTLGEERTVIVQPPPGLCAPGDR